MAVEPKIFPPAYPPPPPSDNRGGYVDVWMPAFILRLVCHILAFRGVDILLLLSKTELKTIYLDRYTTKSTPTAVPAPCTTFSSGFKTGDASILPIETDRDSST